MSSHSLGCFSGLNPFKKLRNSIASSPVPAAKQETCGKDHPACSGGTEPFLGIPCCGTLPEGEYVASDKPPAYVKFNSSEIFRPEVLDYIEERVDGYSEELRKLSLDIHGKRSQVCRSYRHPFIAFLDHPEIMFKEL